VSYRLSSVRQVTPPPDSGWAYGKRATGPLWDPEDGSVCIDYHGSQVVKTVVAPGSANAPEGTVRPLAGVDCTKHTNAGHSPENGRGIFLVSL